VILTKGWKVGCFTTKTADEPSKWSAARVVLFLHAELHDKCFVFWKSESPPAGTRCIFWQQSHITHISRGWHLHKSQRHFKDVILGLSCGVIENSYFQAMAVKCCHLPDDVEKGSPVDCLSDMQFVSSRLRRVLTLARLWTTFFLCLDDSQSWLQTKFHWRIIDDGKMRNLSASCINFNLWSMLRFQKSISVVFAVAMETDTRCLEYESENYNNVTEPTAVRQNIRSNSFNAASTSTQCIINPAAKLWCTQSPCSSFAFLMTEMLT